MSALITAGVSGLFGMAGGLIFMAIITVFYGVQECMVIHGAVQGVSNAYRAYLLQQSVRWDILGWIAVGALPIIAVLTMVRFVPDKPLLLIALGLLPILLWLPRDWLHFDAEKPRDAIGCGVLVMGLNLSAGVAGPAMDMFFIKTKLSRQQIVATKAVTMFASHLVKIAYFGIPLWHMAQTQTNALAFPPLWFFIVVIPCIMTGTIIGTSLLKQFSDIGFKRYTRWLVTVIGATYLTRGVSALLGA